MPTPQVFVPMITTPTAHTNWQSSLVVQSTDFLGTRIQSSGVQDDAISWDFAVDAGTYTFALLHRTGSTGGIYTAKIDGSSVGTIDGYAASGATVRSTITGLVLTGGTHTLQLVMATKNASSSSYFGFAAAIGFQKTA